MMPYIKPKRRKELSDINEIKSKVFNSGELNYLITVLCDEYVNTRGLSYGTLNEVIGVLESAKLEFYRRIVSGYESTKSVENGDVYTV